MLRKFLRTTPDGASPGPPPPGLVFDFTTTTQTRLGTRHPGCRVGQSVALAVCGHYCCEVNIKM
ncbi:hypothetical protein HYT55_00935 [Candidatus Woesearchaeota archaeon]|nr:hypothetical protein [Candidatus Woesearchaeota archaeon]